MARELRAVWRMLLVLSASPTAAADPAALILFAEPAAAIVPAELLVMAAVKAVVNAYLMYVPIAGPTPVAILKDAPAKWARQTAAVVAPAEAIAMAREPRAVWRITLARRRCLHVTAKTCRLFGGLAQEPAVAIKLLCVMPL